MSRFGRVLSAGMVFALLEGCAAMVPRASDSKFPDCNGHILAVELIPAGLRIHDRIRYFHADREYAYDVVIETHEAELNLVVLTTFGTKVARIQQTARGATVEPFIPRRAVPVLEVFLGDIQRVHFLGANDLPAGPGIVETAIGGFLTTERYDNERVVRLVQGRVADDRAIVRLNRNGTEAELERCGYRAGIVTVASERLSR